MKNKARPIAKDAFDISFATDNFGKETRNLTNSASLCGQQESLQTVVIADVGDEELSFMVSSANADGHGNGVKFKISRQTAEQIVDAFQQVLALPLKDVQTKLAEQLEFAQKYGE